MDVRHISVPRVLQPVVERLRAAPPSRTIGAVVGGTVLGGTIVLPVEMSTAHVLFTQSRTLSAACSAA